MSRRKNPAAVALAKRRAKSMTAERRSEIASQAAAAKWAKITTVEGRQEATAAANKARRKPAKTGTLKQIITTS